MAEQKEMTVQVITPDGIVYDHHGTYVSVHTLLGEMGILPNMISTIAGLKIDELKVRRPDDKQGRVDYIAINGGVLEVKDNVVSIISDAAERDRDIDVPRAERAKIRAEKALEEADLTHKTDDRLRAEVALRRAINRINVKSHGL